MLAFVLITGYGIHQVQASDGLSDFGERNANALYGGYAFVNKSTCFENVIEAPNDGSPAVSVVWCSDCVRRWAIHASGPAECSKGNN